MNDDDSSSFISQILTFNDSEIRPDQTGLDRPLDIVRFFFVSLLLTWPIRFRLGPARLGSVRWKRERITPLSYFSRFYRQQIWFENIKLRNNKESERASILEVNKVLASSRLAVSQVKNRTTFFLAPDKQAGHRFPVLNNGPNTC